MMKLTNQSLLIAKVKFPTCTQLTALEQKYQAIVFSDPIENKDNISLIAFALDLVQYHIFSPFPRHELRRDKRFSQTPLERIMLKSNASTHNEDL